MNVRMDDITSSPIVPHSPLLFPTFFRRFPPSPASPCRSMNALAVPYQKLPTIVRLVVLHNRGRTTRFGTRTGYIVPSRLTLGCWQSSRRALLGPWTVENTEIVLIHWTMALIGAGIIGFLGASSP